MSHQDVINMTK